MESGGSMDELDNVMAAPEKTGFSCFSCLLRLVFAFVFMLFALVLALPFIYFAAPAGYLATAFLFFTVFFVWQLRAAKKGCIVPIVLFFCFVCSELFVAGLFMHAEKTYERSEFVQLRQAIDEISPQLYPELAAILDSFFAASHRIIDAGSERLQDLVAGLAFDSDEKNLARLEQDFRNSPGDAAVIMQLAEAYLQKNDVASVQLAVALYEALVEYAPCDTFYMRLAEAYSRICRFDRAFAMAERRTWLAHAMPEKAARQLTMLALASGDLDRGIFELEKILQRKPAEELGIMLLLAGLYADAGRSGHASALVDEICARELPSSELYKQAAGLKKKLEN